MTTNPQKPEAVINEEGPCTDCDDTGITFQTERVCSCDAGDQYRTNATQKPEAEQVLQPCPNPWCTNSRPSWRLNGPWVEIRCETCGMSGPGGDIEAEATAAWNTRSTPKPVDPQPEITGSPLAKIVSYNQAHETAIELGFPSITEALEKLADLMQPKPVDESLREVLVVAEETLDQILDDMSGDGQCVCLAVKNEAIETLAKVRAALSLPVLSMDGSPK